MTTKMSEMMNICQTCLNKDRQLTPLQKVSSFLVEIGLREVRRYFEIKCSFLSVNKLYNLTFAAEYNMDLGQMYFKTHFMILNGDLKETKYGNSSVSRLFCFTNPCIFYAVKAAPVVERAPFAATWCTLRGDLLEGQQCNVALQAFIAAVTSDYFSMEHINGGICWECRSIVMKLSKFKYQIRKAQELLNGVVKCEDIISLSNLSISYPNTGFSFNEDQLEIKEEYPIDSNLNYDDLDDFDRKPPSDTETEDAVYVAAFDIQKKDNVYVKKEKENIKEKKSHIVRQTDRKPPSDTETEDAVYVAAFDIQKKDNIYVSKEKENIKEKKSHIVRQTDRKPPSDTETEDAVYVAAFDIQKKDNVYVKREKENIKEKKSHIVRDEDIRDDKLKEIMKKFTIVEYTEEEMLKSREEKRNRPNYKKLPYKCDWCITGFLSQEKYDNHMRKKHDENIGDEVCVVCNVRFAYERQAAEHSKMHYVSYKCKLCRLECLCEMSMVNHCKLKHRNDTCDQIHCAQCSCVVNTPEELEFHMSKEHSLHCEECGERFKNRGTLRAHKRRTHHSQREFVCDVCHKTFVTKSRLEAHMGSHNASLAQKMAYCGVCRIQYKNIYVYRNHVKTSVNHSERVHSCPLCDKKFASKVYYNQHYNFYHLKKSEYKCEACNKWPLQRHKQIHHPGNVATRPRKFDCTVCNKSFYTPGTLRSHLLTHSDQRSFMCSLCGDTFKQKPALYTHTRRVHLGVRRRIAPRS